MTLHCGVNRVDNHKAGHDSYFRHVDILSASRPSAVCGVYDDERVPAKHPSCLR